MGLRRGWDLRRTGVQRRATYYGAIAGLLLSVLGLLAGTASLSWGYSLGVAGVLLSVALMVPEWIRLHRSTIALVPAAVPKVRTAPAGGALVRLPGSVAESGKGLAVVWDDIDEALPTSTAICRWRSQQTKLPHRISRLAHEIIVSSPRREGLFNGALVRQDDDLTAETLTAGGTLNLSRTDYFSLFCSNYLTGRRVLDRRTGSELVDGAKLFLRDGELIPLAVSSQANAIGVSTLAFSADGRLVLALQGPGSASEAGLYAPAGSGSADLRDIRRFSNGERALVDFLAGAMQRELVEESNIRYRDIAWTEILGYFRWVKEGAKPEYVGVTLLKLTSDELAGRDVRFVETPFLQSLEFDGELDLIELRKNPESLSALEDRFRGHVSMPLFMSIRALGRAMGRDDEMARRLADIAPR
ncbi:hypothetical protein [Actinoplanes solisilvae]|uniref:hypothetical protein n=1 Tax=Actinoplanes solisilvae TaxID=2486853 RepID=UPI000FDA962E|nr:hypothetical protein [Actinoplanes solisilvae]